MYSQEEKNGIESERKKEIYTLYSGKLLRVWWLMCVCVSCVYLLECDIADQCSSCSLMCSSILNIASLGLFIPYVLYARIHICFVYM